MARIDCGVRGWLALRRDDRHQWADWDLMSVFHAVSTDPSGGSGAWLVSDVNGSEPLTGVSCASMSLCAAIGSEILVSQASGGGPMAWTDVGVGGGIYYECLHYGDTSPSCDAPPTGISCVSRPLVCVSVTTVIGGLSTNFSKAGVRKLIVKLTPRGKRLLSSNRLEVTAIGTFAPRGNPTMSATKSFSLRR